MPDSPALRLLRAATGEHHERVEALLALGDVAVSRAQVTMAVDLLGAFWSATDASVNTWMASHPQLRERLAWGARPASVIRRADLAKLGAVARAPLAPPVFARVGPAQVLGWLYVREGSTLGGAVLQRRLEPVLGGVVLETFVPYPEGPGPRWRRYVCAMDDLLIEGLVSADAVCAAAVTTFGILETFALGVLTHEAA